MKTFFKKMFYLLTSTVPLRKSRSLCKLSCNFILSSSPIKTPHHLQGLPIWNVNIDALWGIQSDWQTDRQTDRQTLFIVQKDRVAQRTIVRNTYIHTYIGQINIYIVHDRNRLKDKRISYLDRQTYRQTYTLFMSKKDRQ